MKKIFCNSRRVIIQPSNQCIVPFNKNWLISEEHPLPFITISIVRVFSFFCKKRNSVRSSTRFRELLGFENEVLSHGTHTSNRAFDLDEKRQVIMIYCDILESRLVGDSYAPLLAVVSTEGRYGSIIYKQYDRLQYHKVQKKLFDTVTIYLKDDKG